MNNATLTSVHTPGRQRGAVRVFAAYVAFTLLFSVAITGLICWKYDIPRHPLDFYPMAQLGGDYVATYVAGDALLHGREIYQNYPGTIDTSATGELSRYSYAPPQAYLLAPLALLPYETSYKVWTGLTIMLTLLSIFIASRLFDAPWLAFIAGSLIYAQSTFMLFQIERGQTDVLPLLCIVLSLYVYIRKRNSYLAGALCALGMMIKVVPLIMMMYFFVRRDWRAFIGAGVASVAVFFATGYHDWIFWLTHTVPAYSGIYIGYNIDHSLTYLMEGFTSDLVVARTCARLAAVVLAVLYLALVGLHREREKHRLVELALLSVIMEISTPWSVNYKLLMLVFLFLSPFALLQLDFVRRRPVRYALPLLAAFALIVPIFGDLMTRWPYSLLVGILPGRIVFSNPLDPWITDRKVLLGILLAFLYLLSLYAGSALASRPRLRALLRPRLQALAAMADPARLAAVATIGVLLLVVLGWGATRAAEPRYRAAIERFGPEHPLNEYVAVAGYTLAQESPQHFTFTVIFHSLTPTPRNLQIYLHTHERYPLTQIAATYGRNFYPSLITSYWPADRFVLAQTTLNQPAQVYDVNVGFFDLVNGQRFGEAPLGTIDFAAAPAR